MDVVNTVEVLLQVFICENNRGKIVFLAPNTSKTIREFGGRTPSKVNRSENPDHLDLNPGSD